MVQKQGDELLAIFKRQKQDMERKQKMENEIKERIRLEEAEREKIRRETIQNRELNVN